jgi:DNA-binding XRE family transcriptional regulator
MFPTDFSGRQLTRLYLRIFSVVFPGWISDEKDESVANQLYFQLAVVMSISNEDRDFLVAMGSRIAHLRTVHEITQTRFARALGLSRQTFQGYEEGTRSMRSRRW